MNHQALLPIYTMLAFTLCLFLMSATRWRKGLTPKITAVITGLFAAFIAYGLDHQCNALYVFC